MAWEYLPTEMRDWKRGVDRNLEPMTALDPLAPGTVFNSIFCPAVVVVLENVVAEELILTAVFPVTAA